MAIDYVIAGLGNPGREYEATRHNIGFMALDALASELKADWKVNRKFSAEVARANISGKDCILLKPQTYMNESGRALGAVSRFHDVPVDRFILLYDEFQVPVGQAKVSLQGGDSGHNGIKSILSHLGNGFVRYRLGIGPERLPENGLKGFVLDNFRAEERTIIEGQMPEILQGLRLIIDRGPVLAMNHLNKRKRRNDSNAPA